MKRLAIVTVNYNSGPLLERTLESLSAYIDRNDVEYVLIDGGSSDESFAAQERLRSKFTAYAHEPDRGIYDAMNKGISKASANWVWFVNAGDIVALPPERVMLELEAAEAGGANLVYSDILLDRKRVPQRLSVYQLLTRMLNHQNLIYRRSLVSDGFDLSYKYCADYAHLLQMYSKVRAYKASRELCSYDPGGMSSKLDRKTRFVFWRERMRAQKKSSMKVGYRIIAVMLCGAIIGAKLIAPGWGSRNRPEPRSRIP
jgi:glycosyltransferase involved in cell wall biosynthesis